MVALLESVQRWLDALSRVLLAFSNVLLVLLFLLINAEILLRTTFGRSTLISDEYSGYTLCWLTLAGFLFAMRTDSFLRVGFIVERATGVWRRGLEALAALGGLFISCVAAYASVVLTQTTWRFNTISSQFSETPLYIPQSVMALSFVLLAIAYAVQLLVTILGGRARTTGGVAQ